MKSIIKYTFLGALTLMAATACTDNFEDINTNPHEATEDMLEKDGLKTGSFFSQMVVRMIPFTAGGVQDDSYGSTGSYQHFQGLNADWYSGYIGATGTWKSSVHNGCYSFSQEWGNSMYKQCFTQIMPAWQNLAKNAIEMNQPQVKALGDVVKVLAMHRVTDYYGPIPYTQLGSGSLHLSYDAQKEVYTAMFADLDNAIETLSGLVQSGTTRYLEDYDNVFYGDMNKWLAFANTLRLRLATRVAYADEELYETQAQKAIDSPVGFIGEDVFLHKGAGAWENPIYVIEYNFNDGDAKAGATIITYMNGYNDPRRSAYFTAGSDGKYYGVRMGAMVDSNYPKSTLWSKVKCTNDDPLKWMSGAEASFLLAEYYLRSGDQATAKSFYEAGVKLSFSLAGASGADNYLRGTDGVGSYTDPVTGGNSYGNNLTDVAVSWNSQSTERRPSGADYHPEVHRRIPGGHGGLGRIPPYRFPEGDTYPYQQFRRPHRHGQAGAPSGLSHFRIYGQQCQCDSGCVAAGRRSCGRRRRQWRHPGMVGPEIMHNSVRI